MSTIKPKVGKRLKVIKEKSGMKLGEIVEIDRVRGNVIYLDNSLICGALSTSFFKEI